MLKGETMQKITCTFEGCKRKFKNDASLKAHARQAHKPKEIKEIQHTATASMQDPIKELELAKERLNIPDDELEPATSSEAAQEDMQQEPTKPRLALTISPELAKKAVSIPFTFWASVAKVPDVALTKQEADELGYIFKEVWDCYAPEWMQKYGPLVWFGVALTTTIGAKVLIIQEYRQGKQPIQEKTEAKDEHIEVNVNDERQKESFYKKFK